MSKPSDYFGHDVDFLDLIGIVRVYKLTVIFCTLIGIVIASAYAVKLDSRVTDPYAQGILYFPVITTNHFAGLSKEIFSSHTAYQHLKNEIESTQDLSFSEYNSKLNLIFEIKSQTLKIRYPAPNGEDSVRELKIIWNFAISQLDKFLDENSYQVVDKPFYVASTTMNLSLPKKIFLLLTGLVLGFGLGLAVALFLYTFEKVKKDPDCMKKVRGEFS